MGQAIQFAELGHSTENFNFFVTQSISHTLTLSSGGSSSGQGLSLMNKLITLTSEGKFSLIDTVVDKLVKKVDEKPKKDEEEKKEVKKEVSADSWNEIVTKAKDTKLVSPIEEADEFNEDEALEEIK
jgi:hypothetical protein